MLRVTIDYIPFGDESRRETIETCTIVNDGIGSHLYGSYDVTFSGKSGKRTVKVLEHKRKNSAWHLLFSAIAQHLAEGDGT